MDTPIGPFGCLLAGFLLGALATCLAFAGLSYHSNADTNYQLQGIAYGQIHILDTGMSRKDCTYQAIEQRQRWGSNVQFRCSKET